MLFLPFRAARVIDPIHITKTRLADDDRKVSAHTRILKASPQGKGFSLIGRGKASDDGIVLSYRIERRERLAGNWSIVWMSAENEATFNNRERKKDCEIRVIALNKASEGAPNNTVAAVV